METKSPSFESVDTYIQSFPADIRAKLQAVRAAIRAVAPEAQEKISYQMPTFFYQGNLVHFAAFKHHIGFYPTSSGIEAFESELSGYKNAKGSVRFPFDKELPLDLIARIAAYRLAENRLKERNRKKR